MRVEIPARFRHVRGNDAAMRSEVAEGCVVLTLQQHIAWLATVGYWWQSPIFHTSREAPVEVAVRASTCARFTVRLIRERRVLGVVRQSRVGKPRTVSCRGFLRWPGVKSGAYRVIVEEPARKVTVRLAVKHSGAHW